MGRLEIKKVPSPILRKKADKVPKVTDAIRQLLKEMAETMYLAAGVGLAANQVGVDKQLAVIDVGNGLVKLINPVIIKKEGVESCEEGCLSVPETIVNVKRARKITVDFLDEEGHIRRIAADGLFGRAIQHEIDHLLGRLIIDYLNPIKKLLSRKHRNSLTKL